MDIRARPLRPAESEHGRMPGDTLRRALDSAAAALLLAALAPTLLMIAGALRLEREGPVLARWRAVGACGREFDLLRFRCFRATRLGGLLRATGLSELPQLLNVVRGEMALFGPAPMIRDEAVLPLGRSASMVRPGIIAW